MDVTDEESVAAGLADTCRLYGGLDILVLNAGVAHVSAIEDLDPAALRRVIDVNLIGYFLVLREGARLLQAPGHRRQRHRQLVEERLRAGGRLRRLQRVEGRRAPARRRSPRSSWPAPACA